MAMQFAANVCFDQCKGHLDYVESHVSASAVEKVAFVGFGPTNPARCTGDYLYEISDCPQKIEHDNADEDVVIANSSVPGFDGSAVRIVVFQRGG